MQTNYEEELLCGIALYCVPNIGSYLAKQLISYCGSAAQVFKMSVPRLKKIQGIGDTIARQILSADVRKEAENELRFIEQNKITVLFYSDSRYPQRLLHCADGPFVLFTKGNYDFNVSRIINIIGTRHATDYGKQVTEMIVDQLSVYGFTLVSGLALGIDVAAHRAALKNNLQNIAVLGHGLDRVYPWQHRHLSERLMEKGALLSDFRSGTKPDRQNFPRRNRIVAGMTDATVVIESAVAGGAMITAEIANSYNREIFAIPGKVNDAFSAGCNELVKQHKAQLITGAGDIAKALSWDIDREKVKSNPTPQISLFPDLSPDEKCVYDFICEKRKVHIDQLSAHFVLKNLSLPAVLLQLEMRGVIIARPGNIYCAI